MDYCGSYVPLIRESEVLRSVDSGRKPTTINKLSSAFDLKAMLKPGDRLWLMMGSTNASVALAAFRMDVEVHQLSLPRLSSWLNRVKTEEEGERAGKGRLKVKPEHVLAASQEAPDLFYPMTPAQAEVLEIMAAWQRLDDAMESRKAAANLLRSRIYQEAVVYGRAGGQQLPSDPKEARETLKAVLFDLLSTKDEKGRKRTPENPHIAFLVEQEDRERAQLDRVCDNNSFYRHLFGNVEGVGPGLGARFISAIERIERFEKPRDLSNYAGLLPRGKEGCLPSRMRSKGQPLSRSPELNAACFLLQDHMFQWGRKTMLGQMLHQQVERDCPCTAEQRKADKDLRRRYVGVVKQARIDMTCYFLEKIVWPRWWQYLGLTSDSQ